MNQKNTLTPPALPTYKILIAGAMRTYRSRVQDLIIEIQTLLKVDIIQAENIESVFNAFENKTEPISVLIIDFDINFHRDQKFSKPLFKILNEEFQQSPETINGAILLKHLREEFKDIYPYFVPTVLYTVHDLEASFESYLNTDSTLKKFINDFRELKTLHIEYLVRLNN